MDVSAVKAAAGFNGSDVTEVSHYVGDPCAANGGSGGEIGGVVDEEDGVVATEIEKERSCVSKAWTTRDVVILFNAFGVIR